ncbi:MAG: aldehyde dehydrogenase family protein [Flavobacteriaceae bacterium]
MLHIANEDVKKAIGDAVKPQLIDGKFTLSEGGKTFKTYNPATGKVLAEVTESTAADVDMAVAAARRALSGEWGRFKPFDRQAALLRLAELVEKHYDDLILLDSLDLGCPIASGGPKKQRAIAWLRYYAGMAVDIHGDTIQNSQPGEIFSYTLKEPVGVVGSIIPWNGPSGMALWKLGPALAAGCTIVLKPAEQTPLSAIRIGELCLEAGIPAGVVNIVNGPGHIVGAAMANHPGIDKISFTGSTETGQAILRAAAGNIKKVTLELGGKSPNIVFDDADLDLAARGAAMAVFPNSGQICSAGTRLFVQRGIADKFIEKVAEVGNSLKIGNPLDTGTQIGPLVSEAQLSRVMGYIESGKSQGAVAVSGGERLTSGDLAGGYFVPPTVFANVRDDMKIAREEIFGPVISSFVFDTIEEVVERANATTYGLGSGVWTTNLSTAHKVSQRLQAGSVWVNCYQAMDAAVPFGGYKMSGNGRESGRDQIQDYLETKSVWISL